MAAFAERRVFEWSTACSAPTANPGGARSRHRPASALDGRFEGTSGRASITDRKDLELDLVRPCAARRVPRDRVPRAAHPLTALRPSSTAFARSLERRATRPPRERRLSTSRTTAPVAGGPPHDARRAAARHLALRRGPPLARHESSTSSARGGVVDVMREPARVAGASSPLCTARAARALGRVRLDRSSSNSSPTASSSARKQPIQVAVSNGGVAAHVASPTRHRDRA